MAEAAEIDVAIVGAGPAGLAAAMALREAGVARVTVLEREDAPGGVPRHCGHPPFGMREFGRVLAGPAYARRLVVAARAAGVEIRTRHAVTGCGPEALEICTPDGPVRLAARRVLLATGARETPRSARLVSGDRPVGVLTTGALQAMVYLKDLAPFRRPLIVGTELVGFSALLTARHAGIRPVAMIEAGPRPAARFPAELLPRLMGVPVHFDARIVEIAGSRRVEAVTIATPGGERVLACDGVLFTGAFTPEAALARALGLTIDPSTGGPEIDQFGRCSDPAVFAAGNVLRPIETAGWSWREGHRIGRMIADDLTDRLPAARRTVRIRPGEGIRLVVPQRLSFPDADAPLSRLQLRAERDISGSLVVEDGANALWQARVSTRPERRLLVPLKPLRIPEHTTVLRVGFRPPGSGL